MVNNKTFLSSVGKKIFMSLTGLFLSLFLVVHALGNSTTFWGRESFNSYAAHLHSLGPLIPFFEIVLLTVFLIHIFLGITLFLENNDARPIRYSVSKASGGRTPGSRTMPYTGIIILLFIGVHLANFHFTDHSLPIAELVKNTLSTPIYGLFYIIAMAALALHISHGLWSLFQSLGVNHPKYDGLLKNGSLTLTVLLSGIFILIPICALTLANFLM